MFEFKNGDRIVWGYTQAIGRNRMERAKAGVFIREIKPSIKNMRSYITCLVRFDGNKHPSRVKRVELRKENPDARKAKAPKMPQMQNEAPAGRGLLR